MYNFSGSHDWKKEIIADMHLQEYLGCEDGILWGGVGGRNFKIGQSIDYSHLL